jgi:rhamnose utilization protein RhaD (predicted bifunctional aldolase and dehydrogenase)
MTVKLSQNLAKEMTAYCANIGLSSLLVQGAGGNVSWKDENTLWVKASGTWLSEAEEKDIFVPVDLHHLNYAINNGNFLVQPQLKTNSILKPSIETLLHALMPQKIVVHLHPVEILAHLVSPNAEEVLRVALNNSISWTLIDYYKPGPKLAQKIKQELQENHTLQVIFLRNHGIVVGGSTIEEIKDVVKELIGVLEHKIPSILDAPTGASLEVIDGYDPIPDSALHQLALNPNLFKRLSTDWALYPDHVVFLGEYAKVFESVDEFYSRKYDLINLPELIFIKNIGTYITSTFSKAKQIQLKCYFDVIIRCQPGQLLITLNASDIDELLNWDAEKYRISLA